MELRHLRYFVAAVEEGSLQGAARRVNVAQPALSRQIRELEADLGCTLFQRGARGVRPTRGGAAFYRDALAVLDALDRASQHARRIGLEEERQARLGVVRTAGKYPLVHRALAAFRHADPDAAVRITRAASPELVEALHSGEIDLALLYQRRLDGRAFDQRLVHVERYVLALHPDHRLCARDGLHLTDLAGEALIWLSRRNNADVHDALLQSCRVAGLEPVIGQEAESHDEQVELVSITGGACLTPASTRLSSTPGALQFRALPELGMELELRLAWRRDLGSSPAAALVAALHAAINDHQAALDAEGAPWARAPASR